MIKAQLLSKIYKQRDREVKAINNVSLSIAPGDFAAIIGASGSGKSTLLLTLGGMLTPSHGTVIFDGQSLYDLNENARADVRKNRMGFLFQTFNLIPYLTALQNVQLPMLINGKDELTQNRKAQELLERVGLADRMDHKPSELSVGQQQRIALARMLANDPAIILADEPTGNLDPEMCHQVIDFLKELNREGKTVVLVTHDMKIAKQATATFHISEGQLVSD